MRSPFLFISTMSLLAFLGGEALIEACSCASRPTVSEAFEAAAVVFEGVVAVEERIAHGPQRLPFHRYVFEVSRSWKGVTSPTAEILTPSIISCGIKLKTGKQYSIFGYGEAPYTVTICQQPRFGPGNDLASLGEPIWFNRSWEELEEAIASAVQRGDSARLRALLAGKDVGGRDLSYQTTPMIETARRGDAEFLEVLIQAGANVNAYRGGRAALQEAVSRGHGEIAKRLLDAGAMAEPSLLSVAAGQGNEDVVRALIEVLPANEVEGTAGADALANSDLELSQLLVDAGARLDELTAWSQKLFMAAFDPGALDLLRFMLEAGAPVTPWVWQRAAHLGHLAALDLFWQHGASSDPESKFDNDTVTTAADLNRSIEVLEWFLDKGADPNGRDSSGHTPLIMAAGRGEAQHVRRLLEVGADPNLTGRQGWTALMAAVVQSDVELVDRLLDSEALINARDDSAETALLLATQRSDEELVIHLLKAGADVDVMAEGKGTPLMVACSQGSVANAHRLLEAGADPRLVSPEGLTALDQAAYSGDATTVELILNAGADAGAGSSLARAAKRSHWDLFPRLLEAGARIDATTDGETALVFAVREAQWELVDMLLAAGAGRQHQRPEPAVGTHRGGRDRPSRSRSTPARQRCGSESRRRIRFESHLDRRFVRTCRRVAGSSRERR